VNWVEGVDIVLNSCKFVLGHWNCVTFR